MENKIKENFNIEYLIGIYKNNIKLILGILFLVSFILLGGIYFDYKKNVKHKQISEKYIEAGIILASKNREKSKNIYKEIILSKNKFYSILSLNNIIENNLEENNNEILKFFEILENLNLNKEEKNLIKLKKAIFLISISREQDGKKLLKEIVSDDSLWKESALEISK
jgi:predicted negative regulator of RcsB-dependent stress response|tara:strand:+ start:803 stop:1306 length:504 start_codon:yes stop_codon:yes gene_type:complete